MRTRRRATLEDLRLAIDRLPRQTRIAMLRGIEGNEIIVGAYSTSEGICPMLAAHRGGGRTSVASFAEAWDRVAFRGARSPRARRASERELLILRAHLQMSLLEDPAPVPELAAARREHAELVERRRRAAPARSRDADRSAERGRRPGDADRSAELGPRPGWAWSRIVRRHDDYERLLRRVQEQRQAAEADARAALAAD